MKMKVRKAVFPLPVWAHASSAQGSAQRDVAHRRQAIHSVRRGRGSGGRLRQIIFIHGTWQGCIEDHLMSATNGAHSRRPRKNGSAENCPAISDMIHVAYVRQKEALAWATLSDG